MLKFSEGITSAAEKCGTGEEGKKKKERKRKRILGFGLVEVPFLFLLMSFVHGFKNRTGYKTVFFKISGSTPVFDRFLAGFPVVDRLLTGFEAFNRTGLAPGSRLNRSDRPVRSGF